MEAMLIQTVSLRVPIPLGNQKVITFDVSRFNREENMSVFFDSPISPAGGYPRYFMDGPTELKMPKDDCFQHENIVGGREPFVLYTSPENLAAQNVLAACDSEDYEKILNELANLDQSSTGNAEELRRILNETAARLRQEEAEAIYERLEDINDRFAPGKNGELEISARQAGSLAREYRNLVNDLDRILLEPSKEKLLELIELGEDNPDPDYQDYLEEQMGSLQASIGEYSNTKHSHLYKGLEYYGLADRAKEIEKVWLKSKAYTEVGNGRKTEEDADRFVERRLRQFDTVTRGWELEYGARNGDASVIREQQRTTRRARSRISRDFGRYQRREMDMMKRYCGRNFIGGVKNPAGCRRIMSNRQQRGQRASRIRSRNIRQATQEEMKLQHYTDLYEMNKQRSLDDWAGDSGDPYGFYEYDDSMDSMNSLYNLGPRPPMMQQSYPLSPMMMQPMMQPSYPLPPYMMQ